MNSENTLIDSLTISYMISRVSSDNPPIVFVHGLGSAASDYEEALKHPGLFDRILLTPDLIGSGNSE